MPSQLERIAALEANQIRHEKDIRDTQLDHGTLETRFLELHSQVQLMAVTVNGLEPTLTSMDTSLKILTDDKRDRDTLAGDRRSRKLDLKDWILVAVAVVAVIIALPAAWQAVKEIFK